MTSSSATGRNAPDASWTSRYRQRFSGFGCSIVARGDLTIAILAVGLLFLIPGLIGVWLPALGRGPTSDPVAPAAAMVVGSP